MIRSARARESNTYEDILPSDLIIDMRMHTFIPFAYNIRIKSK